MGYQSLLITKAGYDKHWATIIISYIGKLGQRLCIEMLVDSVVIFLEVVRDVLSKHSLMHFSYILKHYPLASALSRSMLLNIPNVAHF